MSNNWRGLARIAINEAISNTPPHPIENYYSRVNETIAAAYPFGKQKNYLYKQWTEEKAAAFYDQGITQNPAKNQGVSPKQLTLQELD